MYITIFKINKINLSEKSIRSILISKLILGIIPIAIFAYLLGFMNNALGIPALIFIFLSQLIYYTLTAFSILEISSKANISLKLHNSEIYIKNLETQCDSLKAFNHDYNNIIQAIAGYAETNDISGLKKYLADLKFECSNRKTLAMLTPKKINNPAIYSILVSKYNTAQQFNITMNVEIFLDLNNLKIKTFHLARILGILLDNAIEASKECNKKLINIIMRKNKKLNLIIIENTFNNKNINVDKIYEKGYSTKPKNSGIGLWEVRQILSKYKNLNLFTSTDSELFRQQLEIYEQ